ncbi:hypothetical protein STAS_14644 [Striga asiatica]|uniref:Uncharacterized protein n=1 Tax=Striga asiatica TaxID=4170 RepID=A0A5A7PZW7_STRAF|nr:hypothetical protein STAS_14644 [Striga asiatica]
MRSGSSRALAEDLSPCFQGSSLWANDFLPQGLGRPFSGTIVSALALPVVSILALTRTIALWLTLVTTSELLIRFQPLLTTDGKLKADGLQSQDPKAKGQDSQSSIATLKELDSFPDLTAYFTYELPKQRAPNLELKVIPFSLTWYFPLFQVLKLWYFCSSHTSLPPGRAVHVPRSNSGIPTPTTDLKSTLFYAISEDIQFLKELERSPGSIPCLFEMGYFAARGSGKCGEERGRSESSGSLEFPCCGFVLGSRPFFELFCRVLLGSQSSFLAGWERRHSSGVSTSGHPSKESGISQPSMQSDGRNKLRKKCTDKAP